MNYHAAFRKRRKEIALASIISSTMKLIVHWHIQYILKLFSQCYQLEISRKNTN